MTLTIHSRLQTIFRDVFDDGALVILRGTHAGDIPNWDSLLQISLVVAIEKEFSLTLSLEEMAGLKDVGNMLDLIQRKLDV